jgi:hypothetical protein
MSPRKEQHMNLTLWSWVILLAVSAVLATAAQYLFFRHDRKKTDYDWVYIAGGALIGGFTATVWYHVGRWWPTSISCRPLQARSSWVQWRSSSTACSSGHVRPRSITCPGRERGKSPPSNGCQAATLEGDRPRDNLGIPSANRIVPELQHLQVGDMIPMSPDGKQGFWVKDFEANRWMLWTP